MKRLILAALSACFVLPAMAITPFNVSCSTGSASCSVITAPSNRSLQVHQLLVSLQTADSITVQCGNTTMIGPLYFAANSGLTQVLNAERGQSTLICPPASILTITKGTAATPVTVFGVTDY